MATRKLTRSVAPSIYRAVIEPQIVKLIQARAVLRAVALADQLKHDDLDMPTVCDAVRKMLDEIADVLAKLEFAPTEATP